LYGEAYPVSVATALPDQRQIEFVEGVEANQVVRALWEGEQTGPLDGG